MGASARELAGLRLAAQGLVGPRSATPAHAVAQLPALQGQDLPGALTSVALRTQGSDRAAVVAALADGTLVRTWPMRGTLHLVAAGDLSWLVELLAPRAMAKVGARHRALELDDTTLARAAELAVAALAGGRRLRRGELWAAWEAGGVATAGQRGVHLLMHLAHTGVACLGPLDGTQQLVVLTSEWVAPAPRRERDEALGELARRYFGGHGPATAADLARWAGLALGEARAGAALARPALETLSAGGVEHLLAPGTPARLAAARREADGVLLLPGFDELLLGYADRSPTLAAEHADRIVPGQNGIFRPTVLHRGRVVGTWRHAGSGRARRLEATPLTTFTKATEAALPRAYAALP